MLSNRVKTKDKVGPHIYALFRKGRVAISKAIPVVKGCKILFRAIKCTPMNKSNMYRRGFVDVTELHTILEKPCRSESILKQLGINMALKLNYLVSFH